MEDEEADAVQRAKTTYSRPTVEHEQVPTREIQVAQRGKFCRTCLDSVNRSMVADAEWKLKRQMPLGVPR